MSHFYIKYDGDVVSNAQNITYSNAVGAKPSFSFTIPSYFQHYKDTWEARITDEIHLWDSTGTDILVCIGVVDYLEVNISSITVRCLGDLDKISPK